MSVRLLQSFFGLLLCASLGCEYLHWIPGEDRGPPPEGSAPAEGSSGNGFTAAEMPSPASFQASRAWRDLEFLAAEPRRTGTQGSERARKYIVEQLAALGLEVREQALNVKVPGQDPARVINIAAAVPGASSDLILLLAPYDSRHYDSFEHLGVNDGASGAAVLLELAREIAAKPLPYTTWFVFLDGEAPSSFEESHVGLIGSEFFALMLSDRSALEQVRLAVFLNRVCDPDLKIARDLGSHRIYREEFWNVAARIGHGDVFPREGAFEAPRAGHSPLARAGLRRVVALVDTSHGGDSSPGPFSGTEDDDLEHCSAESLGAVGRVTLAGLTKITARLARIDRFSDSAVSEGEPLRLEHFLSVGEGSGEAAASEVTEVSEATQAPEATEVSEATQAPEATEVSEATQAPEATQTPEATP